MKQTAVEYLSYVYALQGAIYQDDIDKALEMEQEQGEYNLMDCKRIVHEGFVYVKLNDLLHIKKKFQQ
jgi:hypothetical protein